MNLPCYTCMWDIIPMIKRELVLKLHEEHNLSKVIIAKKMSITKGPVTQYIQGKRAGKSDKIRKIKGIDKMVSNLAKDIAGKKLTGNHIRGQFCSICKAVQKKFSI